MPDTPSLTLNHQFTYRGKKEVWSTKYHFSGTTPGTSTAWQALADAVWQAEQPILTNKVEYTGFLGHEAGNEFAVANVDFVSGGGTLSAGTATAATGQLPGDAAVWVRWRTADRTSRGKWIYLRKTFHGVPAVGDDLPAALKTALSTYGAKMKDGTLPGGFKICGPQGAAAGDVGVSPFVSFRQLKRTGKRPSR